uniref:Uncharacterized protein n=1 Tax=Tetranychus urticae TaxID=32264 RepID=T1KJZ1_TETUR
MPSEDQQVPPSAANRSGDEVDGNEPQRRPEGQGGRPAGQPPHPTPQDQEDIQPEAWDPDPNHPANLSVAGIEAEAGKIVFVPFTKKSPNDKQKK